jgi:hypothetical protein
MTRPLGKKLSEQVIFRCKPAEKAALLAFCKDFDLSLSDLIRSELLPAIESGKELL